MKNRRFALGITAVAVLLLVALCVEMLLPIWNAAEGQETTEEQSDFYFNGTYSSFRPEEVYIVGDTQDAMEAAADLFGLEDNPQEVLTEAAVTEIGGQSYYRFAQTYQGLPVLDRAITLAVDQNNAVFLVSGNYTPVEPETLTPQVTKETALAQVERYVALTLGDESVENLELTGLTEENLCIYNLDQEMDCRLAYVCRLTYGSPSGGASFDTVIDAVTGEPLELVPNVYMSDSFEYEYEGDSVQGTFQLDLERYGDRYVFRDTDRNMELYSCKGHCLQYETRKNVVWNSESEIRVDDAIFYTSKDEEDTDLDDPLQVFECEYRRGQHVSEWVETAFLLMSSAEQTYEFYLDVLGRQGFNGKNGAMMLVSDRKSDEDLSGDTNACAHTYPNLSVLMFNDEAPVENVGVVAHEFTHSVEQTISAMKYKGEPGCLMEGYSDVMSQLALAHTTGEDPEWKFELYGRDMTTPQDGPQAYYYWEITSDTESHEGSTVISHCAYKIWRDWRKNGADVETCVERMARLFYRCLFLMPSQATMADWRWAMQQVSLQMLEDGELNRYQRNKVISALRESGIPVGPDQEQTQLWMDALTEIAFIPFRDSTETLTVEQMELAACGLLPMAAEEVAPFTEEDGCFLDSGVLYVTNGVMPYALYGLFGEENGDAILAAPNYFTSILDVDNSTRFDYQAIYQESIAVKSGWTMDLSSCVLGEGGRRATLHAELANPDGQTFKAQIVLERGAYPGIFFNSYYVASVLLYDRGSEPSLPAVSVEVEQEQTAGEQLCLHLEILAEQYGVIPVGEEFYPEVTGYGGGEELVDPARLTGLLGEDIFDYDGDGQEELLTIRLDTRAGSDEGWGETRCFLTVYEWDEATEQAVPVDEKSFRFNALTNSLTESAIHLARGTFDNGETELYITYSWDLLDCVFGVLRISYRGALEVTGGVECHDFHGAFYCYDAVGSGAMDALCQSGFADSNGWTPLEVYEFEGSDPDQSRIEHYRACYMEELEDIALIEPSLPSQWMNPDRPKGNDLETAIEASKFDRASIVRKPADRYIVSNGQLTNLCGLWHLSSTALLEEDMTLSVYDEGDLLDSWR